MKKKIKNLTLKQAKALCESHYQIDRFGLCNCSSCPYVDVKEIACKLEYAYLDKYGEEKVEV